jgi:SAM-dependent methyltransferase
MADSMYHQRIGLTFKNRYPEIFDYCSKMKNGDVKIMSFGCSIGTECSDLRTYFPDATIVGVDINERLLEIAKKRNPNEKTIYDTSTEAHSGFDFIFCMTVLCSYPKTRNLKNCGEVYPFSKFEETVLSLVGKLNDEGSIVICNSNFRFADVSCASSFEAISIENKKPIINVPKFDNQNNICEEDYPFCIFKKTK